MNIKPFTQKNILSSIQVACKTLIILILSLLLIAPTPAWALDYNGTLQSYVSKVKVELDGVVTSIQKLPSLSYDNGKTALADIDNKLEKIKNDAGKDAAYFQKLSVQAQQEYQKNLDTINQDRVLFKYAEKMEADFRKPHFSDPLETPGLKVEEAAIVYEESKKYCQNQGVNTDDDVQWLGFNRPFPICLKKYLTVIRGLGTYIKTNPVTQYQYFFFPTDVAQKTVYERSIQDNLLSYGDIKRLYTGAKQYCEARRITVSGDGFANCADSYFRSISNQVVRSITGETYYIISNTRSQAFETQSLINNVRAFHYLITIAALQESNNKLSNTITLTNKISKLCDQLEKRINLATQKFGNVKEYADALKSFSDTDVLTEITELNTSLAKLTEKLAIAA